MRHIDLTILQLMSRLQVLKKEKDVVTVLVERLAIYVLIATEVGTGVRYWIEQTQKREPTKVLALCTVEPFLRYGAVFRRYFKADVIPSGKPSHLRHRPTPHEGVENYISRIAPRDDVVMGKFLREDGRVLVGNPVRGRFHEPHAVMPDVGADSERLDLASCVFFHR